jgi:hypothetical protein
MKCGWCGSENLTCEFVDIGVGQQQVTPYECISCGATEMGPNDFEADEEDKRRGWFAGPDSHAAAIYTPAMRISFPGDAVRARDFVFGQRVLVLWHQLNHIAYKTKNSKNDVFETMCGISFTIAAAPFDKHTTCLACVVLEGAW